MATFAIELEEEFSDVDSTMIADILDNEMHEECTSTGIPDKLDNRFRAAVSEQEIAEMASTAIPVNTKKKRKWAYGLYEKWANRRGEENLLSCNSKEINSLMCRFVMEIKKSCGSEYPGRTMYEIVAGIQGTLREQGKDVNFFDKSRLDFQLLRNTLDGLMRLRAASGISKPGM